MIRIGEFSKLAKTTVKTLRFYDEIDLFKPSFVDDNGYRYYNIEQLNVLIRIVELRGLDMPIDEIRQVLDGADLTTIFSNRLSELENELKRNAYNITLIKNYMARAKEGEYMNKYQAKEIVIPECIVYYRKGVIATMVDLVPFILQAGEEASENNPTLKCVEPGYCYVTYGANEYKETDVEVEYAEAVVTFGKESKNIKFKTIKKTKAISVIHKGSYHKLAEAYAYAINWVKENGYEISEPIRERYINGCWDKENEEEYLTEIQIPVR